MVALAVWLVACGIVFCAVYLVLLAAAGVVFGLVLGVSELIDRLTCPAPQRPMTPLERRRAAIARMFAEPPTTDPDQASARFLARQRYTAPRAPLR
jgi:hypothetical protein